MSRGAEIVLSFGEEERPFRLRIGEWRKVQEACDAGPPELLRRLAPMFEARRRGLTVAQITGLGLLGSWRVDDIRAPILHGLVGGGMKIEAAAALVRELVDPAPASVEYAALAYQVVLASWVGAADEEAAGAPAEGEPTGERPRSPAANSGSAEAASTPPAPRRASRRKTSTG